MALYLGTDRIKTNINGMAYNLTLFSSTLILNGARLLSSDGYILIDSNGTYLTSKESE